MKKDVADATNAAIERETAIATLLAYNLLLDHGSCHLSHMLL